jgi:PTH1 family peptidyl-tRNA hydrolase
MTIKAIIGLGNPGPKYQRTRHNAGFLVVDALAEKHGGSWRTQGTMESAQISINGNTILLIKPQTFMNDSGKVLPALNKQGIKPENILVVHDDLELPFGDMKIKLEGSARGHNGVRSIIAACAPNFPRLRFGIGRPTEREEVHNYVLEPFTEKNLAEVLDKAVVMVEDLLLQK